MRTPSLRRFQRGVAPVVIVIIVVVVVVAVIGAIVTSSTTPSTPGAPPPGCIPAGTQCRLFIQNEVSCCDGRPIVGQRIGWCIGWWDGIPCRGGTGMREDTLEGRVAALSAPSCEVMQRPVCGLRELGGEPRPAAN